MSDGNQSHQFAAQCQAAGERTMTTKKKQPKREPATPLTDREVERFKHQINSELLQRFLATIDAKDARIAELTRERDEARQNTSILASGVHQAAQRISFLLVQHQDFLDAIENLKRTRTSAWAEIERLRKALEDAIARVSSGRMASIGSLNNTYLPQISVSTVNDWREALSKGTKA